MEESRFGTLFHAKHSRNIGEHLKLVRKKKHTENNPQTRLKGPTVLPRRS